MLLNDNALDGLGKFSFKKLRKRLAPPLPKGKLPIPPMPGVTTKFPTSIKEAQALQKKDIKALRKSYVENVMRPLATVDPVMKKHYDHERRVVEIRSLESQLAKETDPARRQQLEAALSLRAKKEAGYQKEGAVVRQVVSIAAMVVPGLQVLAPFIAAANTAYTVAKAAGNLEEAKSQAKQAARQEQDAVQHMVSNGLPREKAQEVVRLIKRGMPADQALQSVMTGAPAASPEPRDLSQEEAQAAFLAWLKSWRPDVHAAVLKRMPANGVSGLGFWDSIASAASSISTAAGSLLKTYYDKQLMDVQMKQLQAQQAPLPTPVAKQQVSQATGVPPPPESFLDSLPPWALPVGLAGLAGLGFYFFRSRGRGRGR